MQYYRHCILDNAGRNFSLKYTPISLCCGVVTVTPLGRWFKGFIPQPVSANWKEQLRASIGALLGILITGLACRALVGPGSHLPLLVAPMGASSVLLFALPGSPLAQPWSIIGGNLVAALVGVFCAQIFGDTMLAGAIAVSTAIGLMFFLRCLHPPSGAIALTAVFGGPVITTLGYKFALLPVGLNSLLLLFVALVFNNATRHRYPHASHHNANPHATADPRPVDRLGFTPADLDAAISEYDQVLDVNRDDVEALFMQTEMQAYHRRFGEILCADIMSRDIVSLEYSTPLDEAWALLHERHFAAIPVIDSARRVIGIISQADFVRYANIGAHFSLDTSLRALIRRSLHSHSEKPEVVGKIMSTSVQTARDDMPIVELVLLMSDSHPHNLPIIDVNRRLVGMVTLSDLVTALYRGRLTDASL